MRLGWAVLALSGPFLLAGCGDHQTKRQALAECRMNAARIYPHWSTDDQTPAADFAYFCMEAKGYVLTVKPPDCPFTSGVEVQTEARCYRRPQFWEDDSDKQP